MQPGRVNEQSAHYYALFFETVGKQDDAGHVLWKAQSSRSHLQTFFLQKTNNGARCVQGEMGMASQVAKAKHSDRRRGGCHSLVGVGLCGQQQQQPGKQGGSHVGLLHIGDGGSNPSPRPS